MKPYFPLFFLGFVCFFVSFYYILLCFLKFLFILVTWSTPLVVWAGAAPQGPPGRRTRAPGSRPPPPRTHACILNIYNIVLHPGR